MTNRIPFQKPFASAHNLVNLLQSRGLTIAMGMQNNTVLRSKPEAWEKEGAKSRILTLRDAFRGVLKELL